MEQGDEDAGSGADAGSEAVAQTGRRWWRDRDVGLLVGGSTVNGVGDWLLELALPLFVFVETGSGVSTAAVYVLRLVVGVLLGPVGGALADRWRVRRTLVGTNVAQILALLPLLAVESDRIWPVYVVVVLQGVISSVNDPATFVLLPRLVSDDRPSPPTRHSRSASRWRDSWALLRAAPRWPSVGSSWSCWPTGRRSSSVRSPRR